MDQQRDILLINKDVRMRDAGANMLEAEGYSVHTASKMRDALAKLSANPIGLVVCGLELEDILATDFISYLKNDPLREKIPFVFYIHNQSQVDLPPQHALELGANDIVLYPIPAGEFMGKIHKLLPLPPAEEHLAATERGRSDSFPESFLLDKEKADDDALREPEAEIVKTARLSMDNKLWAEGRIINHTFHGAMVETRLRGKQGSAVKLRYDSQEGPLTATGRLMHILLGDHQRPMGMGINFRTDPKWRQIHKLMKTAPGPVEAAKPEEPVPPPSPSIPPAPEPSEAPDKQPKKVTLEGPVTPETPIGIEVSRDGALWMYGEIIEYDTAGASISTPVLGKSGETLHIRITLPDEQKILKGRIKVVTLNDFKMPAGMEITFPEKEAWLDVAGGFAEKGPSEEIQEKAQEAPSKAEGKVRRGQWTDTVVDGKEASKPPNIKDRFYRSLIGKKLGNYEIVSFLNSGSMGGVFKGWDIALERDVAIKVISYELSSQEEFVEMFFKEARLVSKLNHPNIAHIYFIGNETGIVYYTMEFIHGHTLGEIMQRDRCVQPNKAAVYLVDACKALDRVWQEKIIHRDIKPANMMISEHEAVKLLDFGVAQQQKKGTVSAKENIVGSPAYLSPETIREEPVDFRSDIYSLGATFYHAMCGTPPFTGKSMKDMLRKHLDAPAVPLAEKSPDIPPSISDVIQKMLAKKPEDRFQSYQEIINALSPAAFSQTDAPLF
jgi:CheY-like chemotaxis protein/predicted Ser/Thr protein kinase